MPTLDDAGHRALPKVFPPPRVLWILLLLTLPLLNPWVRGDGVGYYAFARALLIQHNLDFAADYQHANESFREARLDAGGSPKNEFRTSTGHLDNHFTVGPAILWAPFLIVTHAGVMLARAAGSHVAADGFSFPYLLAMALGTLLYGFSALVISYQIACRFVSERWALLATFAIWWASSLPVYMYFNPSWSHAHSAFAVALFFWYWLKTRPSRTFKQWVLLALIAGLMLNVYYPNAIVLLLLVPEAIENLRAAVAQRDKSASPALRAQPLHWLLFCAIVLAALVPTFVTKYFLYGGIFESGYIPVTHWFWTSPFFFALLFSSNHGLFSWTPVLLFSVAGLFLFFRKWPRPGLSVLCVLVCFYYFMASYPDWAGISSYGNRFFVSLTVLFVLGLAVLLESVAGALGNTRAIALSLHLALSLFVLWNVGLIFQWGAHLIPARGPVSWKQVAHNQLFVVPRQMTTQLRSYLVRRGETLHQIEERDLEQLKSR